MSITRYVTGDSEGVLTIVARALDPNGNPITQQVAIIVNPPAALPKCYNSILALSPVQDSIESACVQFGVANTYYLGDPRNTVYSTETCSDLATDGFYKTEDGNWIGISGGFIRQRGSCINVGTTISTSQPNRFAVGGAINTTPPMAVRIPNQTVQVFVPEPTFTQPSPTTVQPDPTFVSERAAFKATQKQQITQNLQTLPTTTTFTTQAIPVVENVAPVITEPVFVPAQQTFSSPEISPMDVL